MKGASHRQDVELARCKAALLSAHAQLWQTIAAHLSDRILPGRVAELYSRAHELTPLEEAWVHVHTLAHCGIGAADQKGDHDPRIDCPHGWAALRAAMHARELQETLTYEMARAEVSLLKVHVRNAAAFAEALAEWLPPPEAVARYIARIDVRPSVAGAVYSLAVAKLAATHERPRPVSSPPHGLVPASEHDVASTRTER